MKMEIHAIPPSWENFNKFAEIKIFILSSTKVECCLKRLNCKNHPTNREWKISRSKIKPGSRGGGAGRKI